MYLSLLFPSGRYHAALSYDPTIPEWPPHPSRVFSALVAAACAGHEGMTEDKRAALEWLEGQPPPSISAPPADCTPAPITYVPPADLVGRKGKKGQEKYEHGIHRWRQPRNFPSAVILGEPIVYYRWNKNPGPGLLRTLDSIASELTHVGTSHSLAVTAVNQGEQKIPLTYVPNTDGNLFFRIPVPGRLTELDTLYKGTAGLRRPLPSREVSVPYTLKSRYSSGTVSSPFEFFPLKVSGSMHGADTAAYLGKSLRRAVMSVLNDQVPPSVHGHNECTHIGWVPLPDVGHEYASGRIVGVGIMIPRGITISEKNKVFMALNELQEFYLPDGRKTKIRPQAPGETSPRALWRRTWVGPARRWATVTPVILDRPPKKLKNERLRAAISESIQFAGYPEPEKVEVSSFSPFKGAPPAFRIPATKPRYHAIIRYKEEIEGPVIAGRLRYLGIGLFRPLPDGDRGNPNEL